MKERGFLLVSLLVSLLALAGIGMWLLIDGAQSPRVERPSIPHVQR